LREFRQKIERIRFLIDSIKYKREKHFCVVLIIIIFFVSAFSIGSFIYHKNTLRNKENIIKSYIAESTSVDDEDLYECSGGEDIEEKSGKIMIYVCGCVNNPGVYELDADSRICDVLEVCGGVTDFSCIEAINLARPVSDGERIYIPSIEEVDGSGLSLLGSDWYNTITGSSLVIDINKASSEQLQQLPGIGEQIAKNIIDYRQKYGFFKSKEDIKNVNGIGEGKYEKIKDLISI
jgi:competence protein ComEA